MSSPLADPVSRGDSAKAPRSGRPQLAAAAFLSTPSLPQGGGALRGIGETFTANPARGTSSVAVPLTISGGRPGGAPTLSLSYDSGAGNSPFGLGFHLSLPSVARRTRRGLPRYTDDDVYMIAGAEDLVPELAGPSPLVVDGANCLVQRFRPRVEIDFSRIERCRPTGGGADFWRVTSRDNVVSLFGRTAQGRVSAPPVAGSQEKVFEWLLESVTDDLGNVTTYTYKAEDLVGVDAGSVAEQHRLDGPAPAGRYPKTIRYGNVVPGSAAQMCFLVVFDYGEHDLTPAEVRPWPARSDPFSNYRTTFEVRTWRLCRRVLMFHDFPDEFGDGPNPRLVASTEFTYRPDPVATTLTAVRHLGYDYQSGAYVSAALPPLEFKYTTASPDSTVRVVRSEPVPERSAVWWVDLDGDGLPGVLSRTPGSWFYQRNAGGGALEAPAVLQSVPSTAEGERLHLADVDGGGRLAMVRTGGSTGSGFAPRTDDGWAPLRPFASQPVLDLDDPALHRVDLDGDGLADLLLGCADGIRWRPSLGANGYGPERWVPDEEGGPRLAYRDELRAIFFADLSGDGLVDLVRIRNGEVCYWPNLGYGRFGVKVTMAGAPTFDHPERFDPGRIRLGDLDGTGPADLVYLGPDGVRAWVNRAGNGFGPAIALGPFPNVDSVAHVDLVDVLGTGTACLVWTSLLPSSAGTSTRYLDLSRGTNTGLDPADERLAGWKPYLMCTVRNNMGASTLIEYASSTRFFLADRRAGHPWVSRLPFPVRVIDSVTMLDEVTDDRYVTSYRYRHGYFDGVEREFRGFGMVETRDTESIPAAGRGSPGPLDLPPIRSRNWFHLGGQPDPLTDTYTGDVLAKAPPPHDIDPAVGPDEFREAVRALAGKPLRSEMYSDDGVGDAPYTVTENRYRVRLEQPAGTNPYAVVFAHGVETVSYHYERVPADPRISREVTLAVDLYGTVTSSLAIGLPRRSGGIPEQQRPLLTLAQHEVVHTDTPMLVRLGVPIAARTYEVTDLGVADLLTATPTALAAALVGLTEVAYETVPVPGNPSRRLIDATRSDYWADDLSAPLPYGQVGVRALARRGYKLAFTPGLLTEVYGARVDSTLLTTVGGYTQIDGDWWTPSEIRGYDAAGFYAPARATDPFGNTASAVWDAYHLFVVELHASDRVGLTALVTTVANDYRVLAPRRITDPNGNGAKVAFDALGMVVASWALSHTAGEGDPDTLPGTTFSYDLDAWRLSGQPVWAHAEMRERRGDAGSRWQRSRTYADGSGRVAMTKVQAEPGLAWTADGFGGYVLADTGAADRWVGTGRTVYNNKGLAVEQYEPYFSASLDFETADALVKHDAPVVLHYDPINRLIRTDLADGTYSRIEFGPWHHLTYDANDTVADSAWYAERQGAGTPAEQVRAATLAFAHRDTPTRVDADSLGRVALATVDNGALGMYSTRVELDVEGTTRSVTDSRGIVALTQRNDLLGRVLTTVDVDAGTHLTLADCMGAPIRDWTARGHELRYTYDALRRNVAIWVIDPGAPAERLVELTIHGEQHPNPFVLNLLGRVYRHYDEAGLTTSEGYDFQGNALAATRTLARSGTGADWTVLDGVAFAQLDAVGAAQLDAVASFTTRSTFDALNRLVTQVLPDGTLLASGYNAAGLIETVTCTVGAVTTTVVTGVDYDSRRRRMQIGYGNGVVTTYDYDPRSNRLIRMRSVGGGQPLQDLAYVYDAVGNVVEIVDHAQQSVFFAGAVAAPVTRYEYEPIYRLSSATGREHASLGAPADRTEPTYAQLPHPNDRGALRTYLQTYRYDEVGNLLTMRHVATGGSWTRDYDYVAGCNRLARHTGPGGAWLPNCLYDAAGNATSMPYLPTVTWDYANRLSALDLGGGGQAGYTYDAGSARVCRRWTHGATTDEYVYIGDYERYRRYRSGAVVFERHTASVTDGAARVAMIETLTVDTADPTSDRTPRTRYQLGNQLLSVLVECDDSGGVISYEEYHPYGTTSLWLARGQASTSQKRYRYTGKEKDTESGLYYHGARYYAAWLGRWFNPDPVGRVNPYAYCADNPVGRRDPDGRDDIPGEMHQAEVSKDQSQDDVRKMFAARGIHYKNDARWIDNGKGGGYWFLETWQVVARDGDGGVLNMRAESYQPESKKKAPPPAPPRQTVKQKRQEEWESARAGMRDTAIDTLSMGLLALTPLPGLLKSGGPKKTGDYRRDEELKDHYESGGTVIDVAVLATSVVPVGEIAEGANLLMSKLPKVTVVPSLGMMGAAEVKVTSFSEQWAGKAAKPQAEAFSVYFETELKPLAKGVTNAGATNEEVRLAHKVGANEALVDAMKDPTVAKAMKKLGVEAPAVSKGGFVSPATPKGFVWHHDPFREGVMQLVKAADHQWGTLEYYLMHDKGIGGFARWGRKF